MIPYFYELESSWADKIQPVETNCLVFIFLALGKKMIISNSHLPFFPPKVLKNG
jgi:hypothetical protein